MRRLRQCNGSREVAVRPKPMAAPRATHGVPRRLTMRWVAKRDSGPEEAAADLERVADRLPWLADDFLESYVCWREACEDLHSAYDHWRDCGSAERAVAYE